MAHWFALLVALIFLLALLLVADRNIRRWLAIGLVAVVVSAFGLLLRQGASERLPSEGNFRAVAIVTGDPHVAATRPWAPTAAIPVRLERLISPQLTLKLRASATLLIDIPFPELIPGATIELDIRLLRRKDGVVAIAQSPPRVVANAGALARGVAKIRAGLSEAARHLPAREGGLLPGIVDGDTSLLHPDLEAQMRATNLTHLTAVSGANLALVAAFVVMVLRSVRVPRRLLPLFTVLAIAGFVLLARPEPSVLRAAVMAGVLILASATERPGAGLTSLLVAILLLILIDPFQAQRPGFVLSVLATAGLLLFAAPVANWLALYIPSWLAKPLSIPIAAQALCTPYLVTLSGQLSLIGVWTNVLAAPAVAPATVLGLISALLSLLWPTLAHVVAWIAVIPLWWISVVAKLGASFPVANIVWPSGWQGATLAAVLICLIYLAARRRPKAVLTCYLALLLALFLLRSTTPFWPMRQWSLAMCDVGQGDALVIRISQQAAVVVDTGPDPTYIDQCLSDLGVKRIPLLVLTHQHADHVEGLPGVLHGRVIEKVWLSPEIEPEYESARVRTWLRGIPTSAVPLHQPVDFTSFSLEAIWPELSLRAGSHPNNNSIVLLVTWPGRRALLLGDIEREAQARLRISQKVDVVKIAHHGSANQFDPLQSRLHPAVALVSVGADNDYGHPDQDLLNRFRAQGSRILRTDEDGSVALAFEPGKIRIAARGHPWWRQTR